MIRIGTHLLKDGTGYRLAFAANETKTRRSLEIELPQSLAPFLDTYLERWRPLIPGADRHDGLWASAKGCAMSDKALYERVRLHTARAFGRAVNLHLFRDCAATTLAVEDPAHVRLAAGLLGHASFTTTERHYVQAGTIEATRTHQRAMLAMRARLRAAHGTRRRRRA